MDASSKKVRKAVIAAAGFGTRFLPQTKAMPKEMLPLVDKPVIQYVVEELVDAGIEDIIIENITAGDCILFDQKFQHFGNPFENSEKIFIRTELIYRVDNEIIQNPYNAEIFNKACYFSKESLNNLDKDLEEYSSELFNYANQLRYYNIPEIMQKLYVKKYLKIKYLTNEHHY